MLRMSLAREPESLKPRRLWANTRQWINDLPFEVTVGAINFDDEGEPCHVVLVAGEDDIKIRDIRNLQLLIPGTQINIAASSVAITFPNE